MITFKELLISLDACKEAMEWAADKTIEEVLRDSWRGDWLLWLARKLDLPLNKLTLAKGRCANTVRHLMKDERSIKAVDAAIAFGEGKITREELNDAAYAAAKASYAADYAAAYVADDAYAADYAAADAAKSASDSASAAYADSASTASNASAASAYAYADDADAAKKNNQKETSDICVEILGQLLIDSVNKKFKL